MATQSIVPYLRSVLTPKSGPSSIPDDIAERHILKQETSTYNLAVGGTGSGLIVFFPGSPGSRVGAHYNLNAQNVPEFVQWLTTAQDLSKAFNYGRLVSRLMELRSSTLPAGVYALNGTFNAITFEGSLSEITDLTYNGIMSSTANPQDKVNNVLVGDGIAVLSLPTSFDKPYLRLDDEVPMDPEGLPNATIRCAPSIKPRSYDLFLGNATIQFPATNTEITLMGGNLDIMTTTNISGTLEFTLDEGLVNQTTYTLMLNFYGLGGDPVATPEWKCVVPAGGDEVRFIISTGLQGNAITEPITSVKLTMAVDQQTALTVPLRTNLTNQPLLTVTSGTGNEPGVLRPVTVVAYEKVAPNTNITISGWSNYELIPNPNLLKNMTTEYGRYDPDGLRYAKMILAYRDKLDLRSVWPLKDYQERGRGLAEIADLKSDLAVNSAWGWKDLINTIRGIAVPTLSAIFPAAAPVIGAVDKIAGDLTGLNKAAGGVHRAVKAAGGRYRGAFSNLAMDSDMEVEYSPMFKLMMEGDQPQPTEITAKRGILIPTVVSAKHDSRVGYGKVYLLTPGDHSEFLTGLNNTFTPFKWGDGGIFGYAGGMQTIPSDNIYTLLPFRGFSPRGNPMVAREDTPPVSGSSLELGLMLLESDVWGDGVPRVVVTGSMSPDLESVEPIYGAELKRQAAHELGLPLMGINAECDEKVRTLWEAEHALVKGPLPVQRVEASGRPHISLSDMVIRASTQNDDEMQDAVTKMWDRAHDIGDTQAIKVLEVMLWLDEHLLIDNIYDWMLADKDGEKFRRLTSTPPTEHHRGPTQEENQRAKAAKLSRTAIQAGATFATSDWIADNNYRGPSPGQFKYFLITGQDPDPGTDYDDYVYRPIVRTTDYTRIEKVANNIYGNPNQEPAPKDFYDAVAEVFRDNDGRGPSNDQMADLRELARKMKRQHPTTASARQTRQREAAPQSNSGGKTGRFRRIVTGEV